MENYHIEKDSSILSALLIIGPLLKDMFYDDVCVSINNCHKVLAYYPGKTFDLQTKVGMPVDKNWLIATAMKERRKIIREQDRSVVGIPYIGIALPLIDPQGNVVGGLSILQSIEKSVQLQEMANKLKDFISNLTSTIEEVSAESEELTVTTEELASISDQTTLQVNETKEVALLIDKIYKKVNLIGLNAAIEAARVGAAGNGFKVVANEIRNLAAQSAESLKSINKILSDIRNGIGSLDEGVKMISTSTENQASALDSIAKEVEHVNELSTDLNDFAIALTQDR